MKYRLKRLSRELSSRGKVLEFYRDTMELPDGKIEKWDFVHHTKGGGACVVPVLPDERILMIHQYRPMNDRETTELPAGAFDAEDPDFAVTASRELEEETGYRCGKIRRLVRLDTAVAWCDERVEVYLAEDLEKVGGQKLDERVIGKIAALRDRGYGGEIEADGGIREDNLRRLAENGLTVAVMGTALFRAEDIAASITRLHRISRGEA